MTTATEPTAPDTPSAELSAFRSTDPKRVLAQIDQILADAEGKPVAQATILAQVASLVHYTDAGRTWIENFGWSQDTALRRDPGRERIEPERAFSIGTGRPATETQADRYEQGRRHMVVQRLLMRRAKYERVTAEGEPYHNSKGSPLGHPHWRLAPKKAKPEPVTPTEEPVTLANIFPPKPKEELALLRESIKRFGMNSPVVVDEHGVTITGHNRRQIAAELGIDCPTIVKPGLTEEEKMILNVEDNLSTRKLSHDELVVLFGKLRGLKWKQADIAKHCGVTQAAVSQGLSEYKNLYSDLNTPEVIISSTGKKRPATYKPRKAKMKTPSPTPEPEPEMTSEPEPVKDDLTEPTPDDAPIVLTTAQAEALGAEPVDPEFARTAEHIISGRFDHYLLQIHDLMKERIAKLKI